MARFSVINLYNLVDWMGAVTCDWGIIIVLLDLLSIKMNLSNILSNRGSKQVLVIYNSRLNDARLNSISLVSRRRDRLINISILYKEAITSK